MFDLLVSRRAGSRAVPRRAARGWLWVAVAVLPGGAARDHLGGVRRPRAAARARRRGDDAGAPGPRSPDRRPGPRAVGARDHRVPDRAPNHCQPFVLLAAWPSSAPGRFVSWSCDARPSGRSPPLPPSTLGRGCPGCSSRPDPARLSPCRSTEILLRAPARGRSLLARRCRSIGAPFGWPASARGARVSRRGGLITRSLPARPCRPGELLRSSWRARLCVVGGGLGISGSPRSAAAFERLRPVAGRHGSGNLLHRPLPRRVGRGLAGAILATRDPGRVSVVFAVSAASSSAWRSCRWPRGAGQKTP